MRNRAQEVRSILSVIPDWKNAGLTLIQARRADMLTGGMGIGQIAKQEGVTSTAVWNSVEMVGIKARVWKKRA